MVLELTPLPIINIAPLECTVLLTSLTDIVNQLEKGLTIKL